jgi:glucose-6-phosphate isomerase
MELEIGGRIFSAEIRWASNLKPVLAFPEALGDDFPAYYMFRNVFYSTSDKKVMDELGLRYDYTIIPPAKVGAEFIKTFGHYHPKANSVSFPEIYEVLKGEALFILQKPGEGEDQVEDVIIVKAGEGEKVIVPPDYGHVTINPTNKELRTANWVYNRFSSIYDPYRNSRGACYYYTENGWIENPNYRSIPEIRFAKPKKVLGLSKSEEMYGLIKDPEKLMFLIEPEKYMDVFDAFSFD